MRYMTCKKCGLESPHFIKIMLFSDGDRVTGGFDLGDKVFPSPPKDMSLLLTEVNACAECRSQFTDTEMQEMWDSARII